MAATQNSRARRATVRPALQPHNKKRGFFRTLFSHRVSYLFLAPFAILFCMFTVYPVIMSIINSFTQYSIVAPPVFVGLQNYVRMLTEDPVFATSFRNTLFLAVVTGPAGYLLSLLLAWLINTLPRAARTVFVVIFYAPTTSSAIYTVWRILFDGSEYGMVNGLLKSWGFIQEPINFIYDTRYMMMVAIICQLWVSMGIGFLSFVAGLRSIDKQYYEAGAVDGVKNRWQELWYITLPMMKPQLMFGAVMSITSAFSIEEITRALFGFPSTSYAAHTMGNHIWDYYYYRYDIGYACAIATVLFLLMVVSKQLVNKLLERVGN